MIQGIGIDFVDVTRMNEILTNARFRGQFFSETENKLSALSLAGRFAAREALYKAVAPNESFDWKDLEIINMSNGEPRFVFKNKIAKFFESKKIHLSISHVPGFAVAVVIIESN